MRRRGRNPRRASIRFLVDLLFSEMATYMIGEVINVNGGSVLCG